MRRIWRVVVLSAFCLLVISHTACANEVLAINRDGISLMVDITGRIVVPPGVYGDIHKIANSADRFTVETPDTSVPVIDGGGWGLDLRPVAIMDENGELLTGFVYDHIDNFHAFESGDMLFRKGNLYGVMDSSGKEFIGAEFKYIASSRGDRYLGIHPNDQSSLYVLERNGSYKKIDIDGMAERLEYMSLDLFRLWVVDEAGRQVGLVNSGGEWEVPPQYTDINRIVNDCAIVSIDGLSPFEAEYGIIDMNGRWIVDPIYNLTSIIGYPVGETDLYEVQIGANTVWLKQETYERIMRAGIPENASASILHLKYVEISYDNGYLLYDTDGRLIDHTTGHTGVIFLDSGEGKAARYKSFGSGACDILRDVTGKVWAAGIVFDSWDDDEVIDGEGIYVFCDEDGNRGIIDDEGRIRVPTAYGWLASLGNGYFEVAAANSDEWGIIDLNGDWIVRLIGDEIQ